MSWPHKKHSSKRDNGWAIYPGVGQGRLLSNTVKWMGNGDDKPPFPPTSVGHLLLPTKKKCHHDPITLQCLTPYTPTSHPSSAEVQSESIARSQGLVKSYCGSYPGWLAILQLLYSQARRKLQEELPQTLFIKPWDQAIGALCISWTQVVSTYCLSLLSIFYRLSERIVCCCQKLYLFVKKYRAGCPICRKVLLCFSMWFARACLGSR